MEDKTPPPFYCRDWIETHNHVRTPVLKCEEQCDECVNAIIEHHKNKQVNQNSNGTLHNER